MTPRKSFTARVRMTEASKRLINPRLEVKLGGRGFRRHCIQATALKLKREGAQAPMPRRVATYRSQMRWEARQGGRRSE